MAKLATKIKRGPPKPKRKLGSTALGEIKNLKRLRKGSLKLKKKKKKTKNQSKGRQSSSPPTPPTSCSSSKKKKKRKKAPPVDEAEEKRRRQLCGLARLTLGAAVYKSLPLCHGLAGMCPVGKPSPPLSASVPLAVAAFTTLRSGLLAGEGFRAGARRPGAPADAPLRWTVKTAAALELLLGPGSARRASSGIRSTAGQVRVISAVQLPVRLEFQPPYGCAEAEMDGEALAEAVAGAEAESAGSVGRLILHYQHAFEMHVPRGTSTAAAAAAP
eukprot:g3331.t1